VPAMRAHALALSHGASRPGVAAVLGWWRRWWCKLDGHGQHGSEGWRYWFPVWRECRRCGYIEHHEPIVLRRLFEGEQGAYGRGRAVGRR
jgi:hypothetical protein